MRKIVVLGGGAVVRECFLPALEALGLLDRVTVVDASPNITELQARYSPAHLVHADYRTWLMSCPADFGAAIIALPNVLHEDAVRTALGKGLHVLCEKPLTLSSRVCAELAEAALSAGRILAVNMVRRLYPSVALVRYALSRGLIGRLKAIEIEHGSSYGWPAETLAPFRRENGGALADIGVHHLDLAESFAGELIPVRYEDDCRGGVEADVAFSLRSADGVQVRLALSRLRTLANKVVLEGTEGTIEFGVDEFGRCRVTDAAGFPVELTTPNPFSAGNLPIDFVSCFAQQVDNFLKATAKDESPLVDGFDAARTASLIEWAYANRKPRSVSRVEQSSGSAVITGATGFIGIHLAEELFTRGFDDVTALVRRPRNCANVARLPVRLENVDLLDYGQVRNAVRGKRYVFHLAYGRDGDRRRETTVEGTRNIVKAAMEEGCECVIVLSTAYVFGWPSEIVTESAPYRPTGGEYGRSKAEMERWCLQAAANSGRTRIAVLNPTCVYGPWGPTYSELPVRLAREKSFCWVDGGDGAANYTYVSNVVDAMLLAASNPKAHGERFIINDGTATWRSFLAPLLKPWLDEIKSYTPAELRRLENETRLSLPAAARVIGQNPEVRNVLRRTGLGSAAATARRRVMAMKARKQAVSITPRHQKSGEKSAPPPAWLSDLFPNHSTRFSSEKAQRILGWTPKIDLETGQQLTIEHLVSIGLVPMAEGELIAAN